MAFLFKRTVAQLIEKAILNREVLSVTYQHKGDGEIVSHVIAPFDIGTTNPKTRDRFKDNLYAYSYTHLDEAKRSNPKVCVFNVECFISIEPSGEIFDEVDLAAKNLSATNYDYRSCRFALLPNRNWFSH